MTLKKKPYGVVVWREHGALLAHQRSESTARAYGFYLEVSVVTGGRTIALVEYRDPDTGGFHAIERRTWNDATDAIQVDARRWAENAAFDAAEKSAP